MLRRFVRIPAWLNLQRWNALVDRKSFCFVKVAKHNGSKPQKDVARMDIAVDNALEVDVRECTAQLVGPS